MLSILSIQCSPGLPPGGLQRGKGARGAVPRAGAGLGGPEQRCAVPRRGAWELSVTCEELKIESMLVCS